MSSPGGLEIRHLSKSFSVNGDVLRVLEDVSLRVQPGEFVSVVGASGCGKSTLLRLVAGLEADFTGELLLDGLPITGPSLDRGMVFQEPRLLPWLTVEDNVRLGLLNASLGPAETEDRVAQHIDLVGLRGFEHAYPHQLSGGMAQRVAIARALSNRPRLLLLDEPLGAIDALNRVRLQRELGRIWRTEGITMILVTHDVDEAIYLGQRVVVMQSRPGRIQDVIDVSGYDRVRDVGELAAIKQQIFDAFSVGAAEEETPATSSRRQRPWFSRSA